VVTTGVGLEILAQVDSPVVNGVMLQATDVSWVGDRVYAAYNVRGETFAGALQIIDVSNPETPSVLAEAVYPHTDLARVVVVGDTILAAAADAFEGATFEWFSLDGETVEIGGYDVLGSFSATYVNVDGNNAYVSFGDAQGGARIYDIGGGGDPVELRDVDSLDARWVGEERDNSVLVVAGTPGRLERHVGARLGPATALESAVVPGANIGAPTWALRDGRLLYLSADEAGLLIYDLDNLSLSGTLHTDGNANGLDMATDRRLAFLANGDKGLGMADIQNTSAPEMLATIDVLDDSGSANAVSIAGHCIALADGLGGVKIIRYEREQVSPPNDCDNDGIIDEEDTDDDNDGVLDEDDRAPCNPDRVCEDDEIHVSGAFFGSFYNLPCDHPDVEGPVTGVVKGTKPSDFDWFDQEYYSFSLERETLLIDYSQNYFPVDDGLCGDPFHFAAYWQTTAIASEAGEYTVEMGSDDDSWLLVDGQIVIDLGGIHAIKRESQTIQLSEGPHRIEVYFAERHVVQSGLEFEVVGLPSDTARLDIVQHHCLDADGDEDGDNIPNRTDVAPFQPSGLGL